MKIRKGFLFTISAAFFWAVAIIINRFLLRSGQNVYTLILWVTLFSLPFWLVVVYRRRREVQKLTRKDIAILLWMGIISGVGVDLTEYFAIKYSQATTYAFLIRTVMLFTFLFAYLLLKEPLTKKKLILGGALILGAYFLTTKGQALSFSVGDIFTLTEAALIALGNNVFGKMATNRMSPQISAAGTFLFAFLPLVLFTSIMGGIGMPGMLPLVFVLAGTFIGLALLRFAAYQYASASYVTMVFSFTPVFVSLLAIPILGESLTAVQTIGGILIVLAGIGVEKLKI